MLPVPTLHALGAALFATAIKGALVLTVALLVVSARPRWSAPFRHMTLTAALAIALVLPAVSAVVPDWHLGWVGVPAGGSSVETAQWNASEASRERAVTSSGVILPGDPPAIVSPPATREVTRASSGPGANAARFRAGERDTGGTAVPVAFVGLAIWLAGFVIVLGRWVAGAVAAARLVRSGTPVSAATHRLGELARAQAGIRRPVQVLESDAVGVPVAWGFRPVAVVLPVAARSWSGPMLKTVLDHEMAHLAHRDAWTHALTQAAVAVHWFDPLAWVAYHRARAEREFAADDAVVGLGLSAVTYAEQLAAAAARLRATTPHAMTAFVRRSDLEQRVVRILDRRIDHGPVPISMMFRLVLCAVLFTTGVAAGRAGAAPEPDPPAAHALPIESARVAADDVVSSVWSILNQRHANPTPNAGIEPLDENSQQYVSPASTATANGSDGLLQSARRIADAKVNLIWGPNS